MKLAYCMHSSLVSRVISCCLDNTNLRPWPISTKHPWPLGPEDKAHVICILVTKVMGHPDYWLVWDSTCPLRPASPLWHRRKHLALSTEKTRAGWNYFRLILVKFYILILRLKIIITVWKPKREKLHSQKHFCFQF